MPHISETDLQLKLGHYMDQAGENHAPVFVSREGGKSNLVLMSEQDFSGWQETFYLLGNPVNAEHLLASIKSFDTCASAQAEKPGT